LKRKKSGDFLMVVNKEKQMVQKFVKWLFRQYELINEKPQYGNIDCCIGNEEEALKLVDRFWEEI
jgi:hypothetical protein